MAVSYWCRQRCFAVGEAIHRHWHQYTMIVCKRRGVSMAAEMSNCWSLAWKKASVGHTACSWQSFCWLGCWFSGRLSACPQDLSQVCSGHHLWSVLIVWVMFAETWGTIVYRRLSLSLAIACMWWRQKQGAGKLPMMPLAERPSLQEPLFLVTINNLYKRFAPTKFNRCWM
jgi:hypothetical protein